MIRYAITDPGPHRTSLAARRVALLRDLERWSADGVQFVQLREKALPAGELYELCLVLQARLADLRSGTRLLLNSRPDVALAAGVQGVHLTASAEELTAAQVRRLWSGSGQPTPVISVSCHSPADAARAREAGADLILFGPVFEKVVWSTAAPVAAGVGLTALSTAAEAAAPVPLLALGGVTPVNASHCMAAGAAGIAGIRLFQ